MAKTKRPRLCAWDVAYGICVLRKLGNRGFKPASPFVGICANFVDYTGFALSRMPNFEKLLRKWPHYSGEVEYPIGGLAVYEQYAEKGTLWSGKQGDFRRQLCRYLVREFRRKLKPSRPKRPKHWTYSLRIGDPVTVKQKWNDLTAPQIQLEGNQVPRPTPLLGIRRNAICQSKVLFLVACKSGTTWLDSDWFERKRTKGSKASKPGKRSGKKGKS